MNKIKDEDVIKILEEQFQYLTSIYDEKQIFGIFTYGRVNQGFAETLNDIETVVLYIPTFEEICIKPLSLDNKYILYKDKEIKKINIRLLYNLATKQDKIVMEALFSEYNIINPRYEKIFKKHIYINKEAIFHCDQKTYIENTIADAFSALKSYEKTHDINAIFEASRLRIACKMYMNGASCENCINLKKDYHISYLWQIKQGELIPDINEIKIDLNSFKEEAKDFKINSACKDLIKNGIMEIMIVALTDMAQDKDFFEVLTDTETQAFNIILENLEDGHEGNISISQLTLNSGISRPVFKSVLQKMKDNLIAEIENRGVKGTYIKIIDGLILSKI